MPVVFCADESIGVAGALSSLVDYKQNWQLLLAAVSAVGFDSAAGPATAGACGAVAGDAAATGAVSINRTCRGTGAMPYLLAGYLAWQGTWAHTCKRINFSPQTAHPLVPASFFVGFDGSLCHLTVRVTLVSSCTLKTPSYWCNFSIVGCPPDDMAPPPRISNNASARRTHKSHSKHPPPRV